jgi:hypothetical protein
MAVEAHWRFLWYGRGGFSPLTRHRILEAGRQMYSFQLADVDGDGHVDLVTASSIFPDSGLGTSSHVRGDGRAASQMRIGPTLSVLRIPALRRLHDLNGDHRPDIVLGYAERTFSPSCKTQARAPSRLPAIHPIDVGMPAAAVAAADVNGDNAADLVVATVSGTAPFASKMWFCWATVTANSRLHRLTLCRWTSAYNIAVSDVSQDGKTGHCAIEFRGQYLTSVAPMTHSFVSCTDHCRRD